MKVSEFVAQFLPFARQTEEKTGISAVAILAQAALESGWGSVAAGNMFFGIKDSDGKNGNEQLLTTTEYSRRADLKFPEIISITPVVLEGQKFFKYRVKDWFRKYETPEESFTDHARFLLANKRYEKALLVKSDPVAFVQALASAGYATAPNYSKIMTDMVHSILSHMV